jgi:hypothetical protein
LSTTYPYHIGKVNLNEILYRLKDVRDPLMLQILVEILKSYDDLGAFKSKCVRKQITYSTNFFSKSILNKFNEAKSKWISEAYVYLIDNKIVAFLFMMNERKFKMCFFALSHNRQPKRIFYRKISASFTTSQK